MVEWRDATGGNLIDEYVVEIQSIGWGLEDNFRFPYAGQTNHTVYINLSLTTSFTYEARVYAVNSAGNGNSSLPFVLPSKCTIV